MHSVSALGVGALRPLRSLSKLIGETKGYVQGAGGNTSMKIDGSIWVKASGTRLRDAETTPIFVELGLEPARELVLESEALASVVRNDSGLGLRPSIETAIHALLPHRFVAHVHGTGSIAAGASADAGHRLDAVQVDATKVLVPYARPGIPLAHEILSTTGSAGRARNHAVVALLQNHGLIVASDDDQEVVCLLNDVETSFGPRFAERAAAPSSGGWCRRFAAGTLDGRQRAVLQGGPITPDEAVFLGGSPFCATDAAPGLTRIEEDGSVWFADSISRDASEIAESMVDVAASTDDDTVPRYLSSAQVDELVNWDAEKWRRSLER